MSIPSLVACREVAPELGPGEEKCTQGGKEKRKKKEKRKRKRKEREKREKEREKKRKD